MIPWSGIPFLRFTLAFSSGIAFYFLFEIKLPFLLLSSLFLFLYLLLFFIQKYNKLYSYSFQPWLGGMALLFLFFIGSFLSEKRDERNDSSHLVNVENKIDFYSGYVSGSEEEKEKSKKVVFTVTKIFSEGKWNKVNGDIILHIPKDQPSLVYGTSLLVSGSPSEIKSPANPGEFDYKKYLRFHHVFHQHFLTKRNYKILPINQGNPLLSFAFQIRENSDEIIKKLVPGEDESKIASALLLGIRSGLSDEIKTAYTSTGTMHVLAISGMHVAVVFQLLMLLFGFVPEHNWRNRLLVFVILLSTLWLFALITGFSPSVLRAVFMFSVMLLAKLIRKNSNIYNTLFFAGFCLLIYDPMLLADVGFQLSFLAVLGIVFFSDRIYYLKKFKYKIPDMIWRVSSVSLAAQIAVLPLSLFYFEQIPVYFLLANLIAIPLSTIALYAGIFLLLTSWIPFLNTFTGMALSQLITIMNAIVARIGSLPGAAIEGLTINPLQLGILYMLLLLLTAFFFYRKLLYLKITLFATLLFSSASIYANLQQGEPEWVIFNIKNHLALAFKENHKAILVLDSSLVKDQKTFDWSIQPYLTDSGITETTIEVPGQEHGNFLKEVSEDLYLLVFNSQKIYLNTSSDSLAGNDFDYWINFRDKPSGKTDLFVFSDNSELIYSSLRKDPFKIMTP